MCRVVSTYKPMVRHTYDIIMCPECVTREYSVEYITIYHRQFLRIIIGLVSFPK